VKLNVPGRVVYPVMFPFRKIKPPGIAPAITFKTLEGAPPVVEMVAE